MMQYSPKLKTAAEEIKAILKKHDIGALVMLHTPGHGEFVAHVNPSYSCCTLLPNGEFRIKAKLKDFNGDKEAWQRSLTASTEMLQMFTTIFSANVIMPLFELSERVNEHLGAEFKDFGSSSHTSQNN